MGGLGRPIDSQRRAFSDCTIAHPSEERNLKAKLLPNILPDVYRSSTANHAFHTTIHSFIEFFCDVVLCQLHPITANKQPLFLGSTWLIPTIFCSSISRNNRIRKIPKGLISNMLPNSLLFTKKRCCRQCNVSQGINLSGDVGQMLLNMNNFSPRWDLNPSVTNIYYYHDMKQINITIFDSVAVVKNTA